MHFPSLKDLDPKKKAILFSLIVGVAGFAGSYYYGHMGVPKSSDVLVAAKEIRAGQVINDQDVGKVNVKGQVVPGTLSKVQDVAGKVARYDVAPGAPLVTDDVSDKAQRNGLFPGEVGIWVATDLISGGMVQPGQRVNVLLTGNNANAVKPFLQNIRIIRAVNGSGKSPQEEQNKPNVNTPVSNAGVAAAVELAIPETQQADFARTVGGNKVILADAPWAPDANAVPVPPPVLPPGQVQPGQPAGQKPPGQQAAQQQTTQPANQPGGQQNQ